MVCTTLVCIYKYVSMFFSASYCSIKYINVYIYMYIYIYMYKYIYIYVYIYICIYIYIYIYISMHTYIYVYIYIHTYIHTYIYIYAYIHIYIITIHIYIYTRFAQSWLLKSNDQCLHRILLSNGIPLMDCDISPYWFVQSPNESSTGFFKHEISSNWWFQPL